MHFPCGKKTHFLYDGKMKKSATESNIVQTGDPVLRKKAKVVPVKDIGGKELVKVIADMQNALNKEPDGVAIAAPQIGVPLRIFIVSKRAFTFENKDVEKKAVTPPEKPAKDMVAINPEIVKLSKKKVRVPEGCLSVRWIYGNTMRSEKATIRALDETGKPYTYGGSGLIAQIFQHETDHLNGTLFTDHATDLKELTKEEIAEVEERAKKLAKGG